MIVLLFNEGQMCNQLLALSSALTLGVEYNDTVICPIMDEKLKAYFKFDGSSLDINVNMYHSEILFKLSKIAIKFNIIFGIKPRKYDPLKDKSKKQVFTDWRIKDNVVYVKHQNIVQNYFKFKDEIVDLSRKKVKVESDVINVGVHIRRGDYRVFNNGSWFYEDDKYISWMEELNNDRLCRFYLSSNEKVDIRKYKEAGLDAYELGGSAVEDLCCLSMCDYIMGPPSTYSWWASMYGDKKRLILESRNRIYAWDDFMTLGQRVALGIDKF